MMYPLFADFTPLIAGGAAAAAIGLPLLVHLLFRKRYQIVPWAAIRFLIVAERRHKRRIDQWLILALRTLALLLLLFAMVAPTDWAEQLWQAVKPGATETVSNVPRTHHVLVLDGSLSMTARTEDGRSRFEAAVAQAENLVRSSNPGDGFTVLLMTRDAEKIVPGPSNDAEKVAGELRKLRPTHGAADHAAALTQVADILKRSPRTYPRRQLTFFTDLQRSSWASALPHPENNTAEVWQQITSRADVAIVEAARTDPENLAIAELSLSEPMPLIDQPLTVTVTVANLGRTERKKAYVELLLGRPSGGFDALAAVEQKTVGPIPAGSRATLQFNLTGPNAFRERGIHVVQAKLVQSDALTADDRRALAVEVRDGIHALLVDGKANPEVNRRAATYLDRALFPPGARLTDTPNRPRLVTPTEFLDPTLCDITGVDCVFLCDVPSPTIQMAAKLDAVLRRGGTVVIGLGPNAATSRAQYNAVFHRDGRGVLPAALGETVTTRGPDDLGYRLVAEESEFRKPPLSPFNNNKTRAGLISVPFRSYVKLDMPADGRGRRVLSFAHATAAAFAANENGFGMLASEILAPPRTEVITTPKQASEKPDPAVVEWYRHRGRVYVFTSSFNEDWNDWPSLLSYLPFWHEFLKYSVANPDRHTLRVGEPIDEYFPISAAGLNVGLNGPDGLSTTVPLVLEDEAGYARFKNTVTSGLYRLGLNGSRDRVFAVNVAEVVPGTPSESDLRRVEAREFQSAGAVQVVPDTSEVKPSTASGALLTSRPKPWGPMLARFAVMVAVFVLALELVLAWYFGPARSGTVNTIGRTRRLLLRLVGNGAAILLLLIAGAVLVTVLHAEWTGNPLGFLPHEWRNAIEKTAGVPAAAPGEGTKWRLEGFTAFFRNAVSDRRAVSSVALACLALTFSIYMLERHAAGGFWRIVLPKLLRASVFLLALFVLLGQLRLAFDREGLPEVVLLLDRSASMSKADDFRDPAVRAKAAELAGATKLSEVNRLRLAQMLLTRKDADWLDRLLREKQVRVHIYAVDVQTHLLTSVEDESQAESGREVILKLKPEGEGSHLGEGVEEVLKAFRGSPLAAIIMFTDGITTAGDDLPKAARAASYDGVPLFLVGVGDTWETPDLILADLQAEDVVGRGDRLAFEARLTARGKVPAAPTTVTLKEKLPGGKLETRGQVTVIPDPSGNPVTVTVAHTPTEVGEKTYILEVPAAPGEVNTRNNRIERTVLVTDSRRIRVLYVEGYPRYDFRFVKVMMERESDKSVGGKSVELQVVLLDASKGWAETDRSAFRGEFPTRTELFGFDLVILGDVDPKLIAGARSAVALRDLADFVKQKGGGLLFLSGQHGTPSAYADTPLAEVLPVSPAEAPAAMRPPEQEPITEGYQPRLTPAGRLHPLFRFSADEAESMRVWGQLKPLFWYAKGYRLKPLAQVLATHPTQSAEGGRPGELYPLVIQQFAGAGPVLFLGFDDTWRWRFRNNEEHFDRFWMQAVRTLSRSRIRRPEVRVKDKSEFRRDEKVTVQVRFPIEAPRPAGGAPVRIAMTRTPLMNPDGTPGTGQTDTATLVLNAIPGPTVQYETTLARVPVGEYRFELLEPEVQGTRPWATARVLPPLTEREHTEMNVADMRAAAADSGGGFYTLANASDVFKDLKNLQRVPLNQPVKPIPLWNHPGVYLLMFLLLTAEWLLRKRERLL